MERNLDVWPKEVHVLFSLASIMYVFFILKGIDRQDQVWQKRLQLEQQLKFTNFANPHRKVLKLDWKSKQKDVRDFEFLVKEDKLMGNKMNFVFYKLIAFATAKVGVPIISFIIC